MCPKDALSVKGKKILSGGNSSNFPEYYVLLRILEDVRGSEVL